MKRIGVSDSFYFEYELLNSVDNFPDNFAYFDLIINGISVCKYRFNNSEYSLILDIREIAEWFDQYLNSIISETEFPLPISADTSIEFMNKSSSYDVEDFDKWESFVDWYEKRNEWCFAHSWFSARSGAALADVFFRRVGGDIEVEWDNRILFKESGIEYINPCGRYLISVELFREVISSFVMSVRDSIKLSSC